MFFKTNIFKTVLAALLMLAFLPIGATSLQRAGVSVATTGTVAYAQKRKRQNLFELLFKRKKKKNRSNSVKRSRKPKVVPTTRKRSKKRAVAKRPSASAKRTAKKSTKKNKRTRTIVASTGAAGAGAAAIDVAKKENAAKVLVVGDFMADGLAYGLTKAFADDPNTVIVDASQGLSGLVRDDVYNWPERLKELIEEVKPAAVVGLVGMNDRQQMKLETGRVEKRSDGWNTAYDIRIRAMAASMRHNNTPFIWVGLPPVRQGKMNSDYIVFNDKYRDAAEAAGGSFIDVWNGFTNEEGKFISAGPDINGQIVRLRSSDGINMTKAAKRKLAFFVEKPLKRITGLGADGLLANINLFRGPIKPFEPEYDPAKSGRTVVVSLSGPSLDGGDALEGEDGFIKADGKDKSVSYELVSRGSPIRPTVGRIDAAWGAAAAEDETKKAESAANSTEKSISAETTNSTKKALNEASPAVRALRDTATAVQKVQEQAGAPVPRPAPAN